MVFCTMPQLSNRQTMGAGLYAIAVTREHYKELHRVRRCNLSVAQQTSNATVLLCSLNFYI
jgi:hypothetical protein